MRINASSAVQSVIEFLQAFQRLVTEIDSDDAPAALCEGAEVAERLRLFENAERVRLTGNGKVSLIVGDDLKEDACVRAAFVQLSG